jgi:hypothetical protein
VLTISLDHQGDQKKSPQFRIRSFPSENDDLFLRISTNHRKTRLLTHNSLYYEDRSKHNGKRLVSPRDLGIKIFPAVTASSLVFDDTNLALTFNTGDRPTGVASMRNGTVEIGLGRKNKYNDDKGLPEGCQDNNAWHLQFSLSLSSIEDLDSFSAKV